MRGCIAYSEQSLHLEIGMMGRRHIERESIIPVTAQLLLNVAPEKPGWRSADEEVVQKKFERQRLAKVQDIGRPAADFEHGDVVHSACDLALICFRKLGLPPAQRRQLLLGK